LVLGDVVKYDIKAFFVLRITWGL